MKKLFSTVAVAVICSGLAMAQGGPASGYAGGQVMNTVQVRSGGGFMQGPGGPFMRMRTMRGMGHGPMMRFGRGWMGQWWRNPEVAQRIGLTDQQTQQLDKISQDARLKMIDLRANLERQQVILGPMLQAYHPDEAQVLAQVDKVSQARAAMSKARIQTMLATRNVLSEEQWKKLQDTRMGFHRGFGPRTFRRSGGRAMPSPPPSK